MSDNAGLSQIMIQALMAAMVELVIDRARYAQDQDAAIREAMKIADSGIDRLSVKMGKPGQQQSGDKIKRDATRPLLREIEKQARAGLALLEPIPRAH